MPSKAEACALLGVREGDSQEQIRAAYRRRMRSLHPDNGGDDSDDGRAAIAEVVQAWRVLSGIDPPSDGQLRSAPRNPTYDDQYGFAHDYEDYDDYVDSEQSSPEWPGIDPEDRMSPRLLRVFFVAATVLVLGWLMIFFVIAWSQSG